MSRRPARAGDAGRARETGRARGAGAGGAGGGERTAVLRALAEALERNGAVVHPSAPPPAAASSVVERATALAAGRPVAVPLGDAVLDAVGIPGALGAAGLPSLTPDAPEWPDGIARTRVGITGAAAAVAETGSVAVTCGPGAPRAVSLLPDVHVCVLPASRVRARLEEALPLALEGGVPTALVWVSGPSRSADIEKRITMGVHGPRALEVVLVDD